MKKIISIVAMLCVLGLGNAHATTYTKQCIVTEINYSTDEVVLETEDGNIFSFYGTEDWMVLDVVDVVFDNMETESIYDDKVVSARYIGWIEDNTNK